VAAGEFGYRVTRLLTEAFPGSRDIGADDLAEAFTGDAAAIVVVVPRPSWTLCERADELAYAHEKPWLPVVMEHPVLRVGPLVRPPSGPCFACYRSRRRQHDTERAASAALGAAYDADASLAPAGYLPHHARLAAGVAAGFLTGGEAGLAFAFDVLSSSGGTHRVVSCHDCERERHPAGWHMPLDLAGITARMAGATGPAVAAVAS
jgi:bacteriocin biosynthesis cyclodehydratase domain-containing protein